MFRIGDIVVCVDIEYAPFNILKVDERYKAIDVDCDRGRIKIQIVDIADNLVEAERLERLSITNNWWVIDRFVSVKQYRKLKLEKINEESENR
jgi:hypothetical protein